MTTFWIFMTAFGWSCRDLEGGRYRGPFTIAAIFCLSQAFGVTRLPIPNFNPAADRQIYQQYQQLEQPQ